MKNKKHFVSRETYKDDEIGEIIKEGNMVIINMPFTVSGFKNMQEAKDFMRKNHGRIKKIMDKFFELSMTTKFLDKDTVAKAQNKTVELVLRKLGYIS
jgi:methionine aminopeptidase